MTDVLIGKQQSIERCLARVRQAWAQHSPLPFEEDHDKQDIIVLRLTPADRRSTMVGFEVDEGDGT